MIDFAPLYDYLATNVYLFIVHICDLLHAKDLATNISKPPGKWYSKQTKSPSGTSSNIPNQLKLKKK